MNTMTEHELMQELESQFHELGEFEGELEGELGELGELEGELGEFEGELEFEHELTHTGQAEAEAEQFFGALAGLAKRAASSPALRRAAAAAARSAIAAATRGLPEHEGEFELNPIRRVYPDAMMEHLAHEATEAESEQEAAEAFLPLIPLAAAKLLPLAVKALPVAAKLGGQLAAKVGPRLLSNFMRSAPHMSKAVSGLTRTLFRNKSTRPLLRTVPTIVRRATGQLVRGAARGRPITPARAVATIARNARQVIANPRAGVKAYGRSRRLDGRFHGGRGVMTSRPRGSRRRTGAAAGLAGGYSGGVAGAPGGVASPAGATANGHGCSCGGTPPPRCPTCGR